MFVSTFYGLLVYFMGWGEPGLRFLLFPSSVSWQVRPSPLQGMLGTLAVWAKMLAAILSPKAAMQPAGELKNLKNRGNTEVKRFL